MEFTDIIVQPCFNVIKPTIQSICPMTLKHCVDTVHLKNCLSIWQVERVENIFAFYPSYFYFFKSQKPYSGYENEEKVSKSDTLAKSELLFLPFGFFLPLQFTPPSRGMWTK